MVRSRIDQEAGQHAIASFRAGDRTRATIKLAVKYSLSVLETQAPGHSVELRVPPYAAVQCVEGGRHTRGTPRATVETDAVTWLCLATGDMDWPEAEASGKLVASGERSDLQEYLPLHMAQDGSTA